MNRDIEKILIHEDVIDKRIRELGAIIERDFNENGIDVITVIIIMKGALLFSADLIRYIDKKVTVDCINASSYKGGTSSLGTIDIDHVPNVLNKDVLLIDDILDTGLTMSTVRNVLLDAGAASVTTCCLLDKDIAQDRCDYCGFHIPNEFVVGYGLDFQGHYRNLSYIGVLKISGISDTSSIK